jgi:microsomal dipeptidase-like Zn-dependent dipeptidase
VLLDALRATGFSEREVAGIAGDNVLALLRSVCG